MATYSFLPRLLLLALILMGLTASPGAAQVQYASQIATKAGIVTDDYKAADSDVVSHAVIKPTLLLGYTSLRVQFAAPAAAGKPAGLYLKPNVLIGAALLGGATINTYAKDGTKALESYTLSNDLLNLSTMPSGVTHVTFLPKQTFTDIELVFFSTLALGQDIAFYEAYSTVAPLPVVLTAFQGKATPAGVALNWQTASELNADYFAIERADNPAQGYQALSHVASAGTSSQPRRYQFVDVAPLRLGYYRLRQVDRDGTSTYGPVVAVATQPLGAGLAAYPIPATASLTVTGAAGAPLEIVDQLGRPVQRVPATAAARQQLDVRRLPAGTYFVRDIATGQRVRFVKALEL
jgi:hypothetical protein